MKIILAGTLLVSSGCFSPKPGLERTQFDKWERKAIPEVGITFELPKKKGWAGPQVWGYGEKQGYPSKGVVMMHYLHPEVYDESTPLIRMSIYRLSPALFAAYEQGAAGDKIVNEYFKLGSLSKFATEMRMERLAYPRFKDAEFLCFRKDYKAPNGDVILAGAEIFPALLKPPYTESQQAEDRKAVERILNSIHVK
jgi:hypothetical protein